ncbi:hypothetical protein [Streptomyces montanisoli]|uniref:Uncharacterized protein n=1 Tax=Streptomyces montanisoli TaxID=2798581 RepID=A0A940MDX9_9ACTN|nr:hypothetical protein [Streptomyces montanisoli]MBP0461279.1 hypothetical protein [Streptomyces montanisoli]
MRADVIPPPLLRGLLRTDAQGVLVPQAAWHWECGAGARRWSFYVRPDLYAPGSGQRVTAHCFEEQWRLVSALPRAGGLPPGLCRSVDSWKLVVVLARPDEQFPRALAASRLTLASRSTRDELAALLDTDRQQP